MRERFPVEQIVAVLKQAELGLPVSDLIRMVGIPGQTFYRWKKQYAGLEELEFTESALIRNGSRVLSHLTEVRTTGVEIAIDDFGTGHSTFTYLQRLPASIVKLASVLHLRHRRQHARRDPGAVDDRHGASAGLPRSRRGRRN